MTMPEFSNRFNQFDTILQSFAQSLTKNAEDAKDLYQETAFKAFKNFEKYQQGTNLKAWLMTIMKNIFINNYRRKVKNPTILDDTNNDYYINSGKQTTVNKATSNIMMDELTKMMDELDETLRLPFLMHHQGYKYTEIAEEFDLPLGTVKSRIFFAKKNLRTKIMARYGHREVAMGR